MRRYMQVMLSDRRKLPDLSELKVTNHMNREAIQQVRKEKTRQEKKEESRKELKRVEKSNTRKKRLRLLASI